MGRFLGCLLILGEFFDSHFHLFEKAIFLYEGALSCYVDLLFAFTFS